MKGLRLLNIHHMVTLMTFKENDFNAQNAGLDLDSSGSNVNRIMVQIESYVPYPVFIRGKKRNHNYARAVIGFTPQGQDLYFSIKTFVQSVMLINKDGE